MNGEDSRNGTTQPLKEDEMSAKYQQLEHEHKLLVAKQDEIEHSYDELADAHDQQTEELNALKEKNKELSNIVQLRKDDLQDMLQLQKEMTTLQDRYKSRLEELEKTKSELRKAQFQLDHRNRSREGSFAAKDIRRARSVASDRAAMAAREKIRTSGNRNNNNNNNENNNHANDSNADDQSLKLAMMEITAQKKIHLKTMQELQKEHAREKTALEDALSHEAELRSHLQKEVRRLSRSNLDSPPVLSRSRTASESRMGTTEKVSPMHSIGEDVFDDSELGSDGESGGLEISLADELSMLGGKEGNTTSKPFSKAESPPQGSKQRIVLPVSARLSTELRTEAVPVSDASAHESIQQTVIMELEAEIAELREELEDLLEERDSHQYDVAKLQEVSRNTDVQPLRDEIVCLKGELSTEHMNCKALALKHTNLQTEHESLQRRFLARGDQLITLRSICQQNGLNGVVAAALLNLKKKHQFQSKRKEDQNSPQLRDRLYTQLTSPSSVAARRVRAASMSVSGKFQLQHQPEQPHRHQDKEPIAHHQQQLQQQLQQQQQEFQPKTRSHTTAPPSKKMSPMEVARLAARKRKELNLPVGDTSISLMNSISEEEDGNGVVMASSIARECPTDPTSSPSQRMSTRERLHSVSGRLRMESLSIHKGSPPQKLKPQKPKRPKKHN
eukprot:m.124494 g.124494  ORF g.124494 m.124494 type:complete len:674 (-) comp9425_c6_seq2:393-2414(-)